MTNNELIQYLQEKIQNAEIVQGIQFPEITVATDNLTDTFKILKEDENLDFDYLISLTAMDKTDHFLMVYHLESTSHEQLIVLKTKAEGRENPCLETACFTWATAEFHEREVYDLFGVKFNNHPDMQRIFLPDEWEGYPLRKDYVDEINLIVR